MSWPNALTVARIFLTFGFVAFALQKTLGGYWLAAILFAGGAVTDYLDGYLARKYNLHSDFGKIMDPIADKFLTLSAFFIFMQLKLIPGWMFYLVAAREILVTASRLSLMNKGQVLPAEKSGKVKTVIQMVTILIGMSILIINASRHPFGSFWYQQSTLAFESVLIQGSMLLVAGLTTYSGLKYFWNNQRQLF